MTARSIQLRVLTERGIVLEDEAVSIVSPGELGYLGILYNHAPLVTTLSTGKLTWKPLDGRSRVAFLGPGLLEVYRNQVTIVTETFSQSQPQPT